MPASEASLDCSAVGQDGTQRDTQYQSRSKNEREAQCTKRLGIPLYIPNGIFIKGLGCEKSLFFVVLVYFPLLIFWLVRRLLWIRLIRFVLVVERDKSCRCGLLLTRTVSMGSRVLW